MWSFRAWLLAYAGWALHSYCPNTVVRDCFHYAIIRKNHARAVKLCTKETNFVATFTGKDMVPPVNTAATGVARFHINPDGSPSVDVNHITGG